MGQQAKLDMEERSVEVNREKLIETLKTNKEKHIEEYKKALIGYREVATAKLKEDGEIARTELENNLKQIADDIQGFDPEKPHRFSDHFILIQRVIMTLSVPKSYADMYGAAIDMALWDVNDNLKLTYFEFQCFVRDKWDWTEDFQTTNMSYSG